MNYKLKALAAALAVVATTPVFASAIPATTSGNGGLFLSAWDSAANAGAGTSYTLNLGMVQSTFNGNTSYTFAPDANMASFLSQVTAGNVVWNVVAGDSTGGIAAGMLNYFVTAASAPSAANTQLNKASIIDTYINSVDTLLSSSNSTVRLSTGATDASYAGSGAFGASLGSKVTFSTTAHLGNSLGFYELSSSSTNQLAKANLTTFAGAWNLGTNGALTYSVSAVPVPPAAWLFGSGLVGLVGVARRKNGKA